MIQFFPKGICGHYLGKLCTAERDVPKHLKDHVTQGSKLITKESKCYHGLLV